MRDFIILQTCNGHTYQDVSAFFPARNWSIYDLIALEKDMDSGPVQFGP